DLDDIYRKTPFDKIVLALPPEESRSLGAVKDFCSGKGIKLCNFELKESEISKGLKSTKIAIDGIAVIANKENKLNDISKQQVKNIYTGVFANWSEV
ncbi:MAG: substrate-binding domain-containing protein, partial [Oscillospiraceae bacterium]